MGAIDIGAPAIDRSSEWSADYTLINKGNPANDTGTIDEVEIYAVSGNDLANCEVATFYKTNSTIFSTHDTETIGSVTSGSKQTFSGLDMDVVTGDYLGIYYSGGKIETDFTGDGVWGKTGDQIPCVEVTFTSFAGSVISLYGTGETVVTEKFSSDSGSGVDSIVSGNPLALLTKSDSGVGVDSSLFALKELFATDTGTGIDTASLLATLLKTDSGVGAELSQLLANLTAQDTATGQEVSSLLVHILKSDLATATDTAMLVASFLLADAGVGLDAILALWKVKKLLAVVKMLNRNITVTMLPKDAVVEILKRHITGRMKSDG